METEVKKTENAGLNEYQKLKEDAKKLGIKGNLPMAELKEAVEKKSIEARLTYEYEISEKLKHEYKLKLARAEIIAESESLCIPIDLPEKPTELDLAKARKMLGMKKKEPKPSPETLAIEASKRAYYLFRNLEQEDVDISCIPGGKYHIDLIPNKVHVLSEYHIKFFRQKAVVPVMERVPRADGKGEDTQRTGSKPRFT
ncbi:unnamed protein product, partial [marine sediment metagenome]